MPSNSKFQKFLREFENFAQMTQSVGHNEMTRDSGIKLTKNCKNVAKTVKASNGAINTPTFGSLGK